MAISLQKGQRISLDKDDGQQLTQICLGVNWGVITKDGFFGKKNVAVDLDASCITYDNNKKMLETVYFRQLTGQGIKHSGDDRTGDVDGDDGLDNEVITVSLPNVGATVDQIVFVLNSFNKQDFKDIPFASIRLYEGTPDRVDTIHAVFDIANDQRFAGSIAMVMGKMYKKEGKWKFAAIGDPTKDQGIEGLVKTVQGQYL